MRTEIDAGTIPPNLLPRVERVAEFTAAKLQVFESYDIEVRWSGFVEHGVPIVLLKMGVFDDEGVMRWADDIHLVPSFFEDSDANVQRRVREIVFRFLDLLLEVSRDHIRQMRADVLRREPVSVGG